MDPIHDLTSQDRARVAREPFLTRLDAKGSVEAGANVRITLAEKVWMSFTHSVPSWAWDWGSRSPCILSTGGTDIQIYQPFIVNNTG